MNLSQTCKKLLWALRFWNCEYKFVCYVAFIPIIFLISKLWGKRRRGNKIINSKKEEEEDNSHHWLYSSALCLVNIYNKPAMYVWLPSLCRQRAKALEVLRVLKNAVLQILIHRCSDQRWSPGKSVLLFLQSVLVICFTKK
jgi:hypothetical protein